MKIFVTSLLAAGSFLPYFFVRKFSQSKQKDISLEIRLIVARISLTENVCLHILPLQVRPPSLSARREGVALLFSRSHVLHGLKKTNIAGNVPITASTFHSPVQNVEVSKIPDLDHLN